MVMETSLRGKGTIVETMPRRRKYQEVLRSYQL